MHYAPGAVGQPSQQTSTTSNETHLSTDLLDWPAQFDICAPHWSSTYLPDDSEPLFFPSSLDIELFSRPHALPPLPIPEGHNSPSPKPTPGPGLTSTESKSKASPDHLKSNPGSSNESSARVEKRSANTLAARRYRQKRLDQVAELETALKEAQRERDEFKNQMLKLQGETELLKDLLRQKS